MTNDEFGKGITSRINIAIGHLEGIKKMIEANNDCEKVLLQLNAVESAINKTGKLVLKNHLNTCVKNGLISGDVDILEKFNKVLDKYL